MAYVSLLRCADDSLYWGWTNDMWRRLAAHRSGDASRYARGRRPVELALVISVVDPCAALREKARIKHPGRVYLGESDPEGRREWLAALDKIEAFRPARRLLASIVNSSPRFQDASYRSQCGMFAEGAGIMSGIRLVRERPAARSGACCAFLDISRWKRLTRSA